MNLVAIQQYILQSFENQEVAKLNRTICTIHNHPHRGNTMQLLSTDMFYISPSVLVFSGPHIGLSNVVCPVMFSHECRPLNGPVFGI